MMAVEAEEPEYNVGPGVTAKTVAGVKGRF